MAKLRKVKEIETFKPKLESRYEQTKSNREKALEVANNTPDEIKNKKIKYDLRR
jgi:hypothetical protein